MSDKDRDDVELAMWLAEERTHQRECEPQVQRALNQLVQRAEARWSDGWKLHQRLWVRRGAAITTAFVAIVSFTCWRHFGDADTHRIVTQPQPKPASSPLAHDDGDDVHRPSEPEVPTQSRDVRSNAATQPKSKARTRPRRLANQEQSSIDNDDRLQAAVRTLIEVPETDDACVAFTLDRSRHPVDEQRLMAIVASGSLSAKVAAVRLLGWVGSESSVPMLLLHRNDPAVGNAAKSALNRRVSSEQLAMVVVTPGLPAVRRAALQQLICRSDDKSVAIVYGWVAQRATRDAVLDLVRTQADLPIEAWWNSIENGEPVERYVAGYLLAQVNRTDLVRQLIERSRQLPLNEAVVYCLMNHPSPLAKRFIQAANREAATAHFMNQVRLNAQLALR